MLTGLALPLFRTAVRLPFVCSSKRKEAKEMTPGTAPAAPVHSNARSDGMHAELTSLSRCSDNCAHRRSAPDTRRPCASPSPVTGRNTARYPMKARCKKRSTCERFTSLFVRIRQRLIRYKCSLSEHSELVCIGPLGRSAEQRRRKAERDSQVFEPRVARRVLAVPLSVFAGRAPARSAGARQGVFSLGYLSLDKQREVTRTAVRNPKHK